MKRKAVADTCVCLDLWHGNLLPNVGSLGVTLSIPDLVAEELKNPGVDHFVAAGMKVVSGDGDVVALVFRWREIYRKPSLPDLFAMGIARRSGAILLTGDKHLRAASPKEGVEARGILWLLDQLEGKVSQARLAQALEQILSNGAFLPKLECERRLNRWRK